MFDISLSGNAVIKSVEDRSNTLRFIKSDDEYEVTAWIYWKKDMPVIYEEPMPYTEKVMFYFSRMTHSLWRYVEQNIIDVHIGMDERDIEMTYNFMKMRAFIVRWLLKRWTLPIELERENNGELTIQCFERLMTIHPKIMSYFIDKIEGFLFLSENERNVIAKQCALLFMPNSPGVVNAHESVALYCSLSSFWEKFGLNYFDLMKLPNDVYIKLRTVMGFESDFRNKITTNAKKQPNITYGTSRKKGKRERIA